MKTPKNPQDKKTQSYAKDRRNTYGENTQASRKSIALRKAKDQRAIRHSANAPLLQAHGTLDINEQERIGDAATRKRMHEFHKEPDEPLGAVVARRVEMRPLRRSSARDRRREERAAEAAKQAAAKARTPTRRKHGPL